MSYKLKVGPDSSQNDGISKGEDEHRHMDYVKRAYPTFILDTFVRRYLRGRHFQTTQKNH